MTYTMTTSDTVASSDMENFLDYTRKTTTDRNSFLLQNPGKPLFSST
jgi:hypothetical protein